MCVLTLALLTWSALIYKKVRTPAATNAIRVTLPGTSTCSTSLPSRLIATGIHRTTALRAHHQRTR